MLKPLKITIIIYAIVYLLLFLILNIVNVSEKVKNRILLITMVITNGIILLLLPKLYVKNKITDNSK